MIELLFCVTRVKLFYQINKTNRLNLILNNISKKYGSHTVLAFEDWRISSGVYWLKGGNGTGKTTFFRIISGQTPFDGEVLFDDLSLKKDPIKFKQRISYAEAEPQYPLFISGRELLNFYKDIRSVHQDEVNRLTTLFEMTEFLDQKVGGYSSGMLKKLSLICALLGDVELYILDEPLITIDTASADKLYDFIKQKVKEGKSFLLSSHQDIDTEKIFIDGVFKIADKEIVKC